MEIDLDREHIEELHDFLVYFGAKHEGKFSGSWADWIVAKMTLNVCITCDTNHVDNCPCCFGFGFDGDGAILSASRAETFTARFTPCPMCAGTPWGAERC